jgi:FGGY-family pentulose kinase
VTRFYLGVDVGTRSARAGIFDDAGNMHASAAREIQVFRPAAHFAEHSSEDIWRAVCEATRAALAIAKLAPEAIAGIGFDATCSLVALGEGDAPVTVSPTGKPEQNVIVWMDHRAVDQARRINETKHEVLKYVGGVISPEMQTPKLLWLKENLRGAFDAVKRFLDLPDFLSYRATGSDVRSLCTTVCKWTHTKDGWNETFFRGVGLGELADEGFTRIGARVRPMGERAGGLTEAAAREMGLAPGTAVAVSIIDAHAGGLGLLGADLGRLALICGTSSCAMAVSREPKFVPGVWGPYFSAMVPGMWLTEGGQSATGALVDHVVRGSTISKLNARLEALSANVAFPALLARDVHVLPDHHGNRSPRADPTLRGMISGLTLETDEDTLAVEYLATVQGIAHGARHVIDAMRAAGHTIEAIAMCGGDTKNPVFVREHADATGCRVVLPKEPEAVMLGAAILGRVASGDSPSVQDAMSAMCHEGAVIEPAGGAVAEYHAKKHAVFLRMHEDQMAYRALMA